MKLTIATLLLTLLATAHDPSDLFASGDFPAAAAAARATLARSPADSRALLVAGTIALYENDLAGASADLRRIPPGGPDAVTIARLESIVEHRQRLARHRDVTFGLARDAMAFVETQPLPAISVTVNGHRALFQIDTGAPGIAIDRDVAKALALPSAPAHRAILADGKPVRLPAARVNLGLGSATFRDLSADVLPLHQLMHGSRIDGVIGAGVLERFAGFTLDYAKGELVTYAPSAKVPVESESCVPLYLIDDHFLAIRTTIAGIEGISLIDTGLIGAGIVPSKNVIDRAHLALSDGGIGTVPNGARQRISRVTVPEVRIGASVEHDLTGFASPGASPADRFPFAVNGTISHGFFDHRSVTFDLTHMQLSISARAPK